MRKKYVKLVYFPVVFIFLSSLEAPISKTLDDTKKTAFRNKSFITIFFSEDELFKGSENFTLSLCKAFQPSKLNQGITYVTHFRP